MNPTYLAIARLLTEVAPVVFEGDVFALKGGTAINEALRAAREKLAKRGFTVRAVSAADMGETKLLVQRGDLLVKVEVNTVIRGTVGPIVVMPLSAAASDVLMADLELPLLSAAEIYGGKLVAAMDRQHPRDLFDVMELFAHGRITPEIRRAFVVYLASHNRTLHDVLFPPAKDIRLAFEGSFDGMTTEPVALDTLLETRERLFHDLPTALDAKEREFLLTLVRAEPNWKLLGIPHLDALPAIRWRLQNLQQLANTQPARFRALSDELAQRFRDLPISGDEQIG